MQICQIFSHRKNTKYKTRHNHRLIGFYSDKADINVKLDEVISSIHFIALNSLSVTQAQGHGQMRQGGVDEAFRPWPAAAAGTQRFDFP